MTGRFLTRHEGLVSPSEREALLGQRGCVLWFTGLSGSGKSTLARALERALCSAGRLSYVLDGDNLRLGLNGDLGFAPEDRVENIRRVGEVAALFADAGLITLTAFISPYRSDRLAARERVGAGRFFEVHVAADVEVCEGRDPKGLYRKARAGEIPEFTGVSAPYELPDAAELVVDTGRTSIDDCVEELLAFLEDRGVLHSDPGEGASS